MFTSKIKKKTGVLIIFFIFIIDLLDIPSRNRIHLYKKENCNL